MKRKWTDALSPVRRQSLFMDRMVAVCRMLPQWTERTDGGGLVRLLVYHITLHANPAFLLTHGLVSGGYRRGMMENQDLGLKLPGCLWAQLRGNHHHALPDG